MTSENVIHPVLRIKIDCGNLVTLNLAHRELAIKGTRFVHVLISSRYFSTLEDREHYL